MALFGQQARLRNCLWWADLASWPNPDSPQGQARRENCFDRHMRVGPAGTAPRGTALVNREDPISSIDIVVERTDPLVSSGNGKYALPAKAPVRESVTTAHVSPWSPLAMVRPPQQGTPAPTGSQPEGDKRGMLVLIGIAVLVAVFIYRS